MKRFISNLNNEEGSAIVIALIILVLLTMIGISATDNTVIELQIVRNEAIYRQNFYKAEGAVIEAAQILEVSSVADSLPPSTSYIWLKDSSTLDDMTVVGDWNAWEPDAQRLKDTDGDGKWEITIKVERDGEYRYQFIVDDEDWISDPAAPLQVKDGFGGTNSVLNI